VVEGAGKERGTVRAILSDRSVASVIALALFLNLGTGIVLPILPLFARSFGVDYGQTGLLVGAFYFARLLSDLAAGTIVNRLGVRRSAGSGLLLLAVGALLTALSPNFWLAVICWASAGAGAGTVFAAMYNALIRGVDRSRMARALSLFYGAFNGGVVAGGFLGGLVASRLGLAAPLFFLAGIAGVLAVVVMRLLREPPRTAPLSGESGGTLPKKRASVLTMLRIPGFAAAVVAALANLWVFGAVFNTLVPLFARDRLHLSALGIGILYAIALAVEFFAYYPAGSWADTRGRRYVLIPAFALLAIATIGLGWATSVVVFAILLALLGMASAFSGVPPAAILADVLPVGETARGVAIFRFGVDVGFTLGPLVAGLTAGAFGFSAAFAITGVPCLVALVVVGLSRETLARQRIA
jgi:DHA1 family multidrug resistance protein-like MFS transporter